ncbi:Mgm101p-domain-containing protein [Annulohypoxylon maeteangense]|uniref:Mgm101p-domain-containing protein n=1 Tax=Annulohypoxylon maeteangense TaxID=1927788 RepID=UPI0020076383|nr:Mgm101p-domain-containing protein [Annulohypoxylon maeteangense]KAI0887855.1 Mgm101p-domain-containing protein [Annulohypoxylon maeteangense]
MASRTLTPLRAASGRLQSPASLQNLSHLPRRTLVSASKAKPYQVPPRSTATSTSTFSKPAPAASTTTSKPTPTPAAAAPKQTPTAARTPVPAVSGVPLPDAPSPTSPAASADHNGSPIDWTQSYHGLGTSSFGPETAQVLQARLDADDIEVKPDGIIYLPEIKYRRILNAAFGPGGWGLAPRGQLMVHEKLVTREYALVVHGRFVAQARGEQQYFTEDGVSTAAEGCKSNALMRCCKDLGIASELWDPRFIRKFMKEHAVQQWVEHVTTKKKKQIWLRKDDEVRYPFKKT